MVFGKPWKKNVNTVMYAEEKCDDFLRAETAEKELMSLQHCSQLVDKLASDRVKKIVGRAAASSDFRVKKEAYYLAIFLIRYFVVRFRWASRILLVLCIGFLCAGVMFNWPREVTLCVSYILGALSAEVALANLFLRMKQKVLHKWDLKISENK